MIILQSSQKDIGFPVRRAVPVEGCRALGPFVFIDHMGPAQFAANETSGDVRPHPHIGLATFTYLFSGGFMHRDSLGTEQRIEPGAVNLMAAGKGIVHSERVPQDIRNSGSEVEGMQLWLALPKPLEAMKPEFSNYPAREFQGSKAHGYSLKVLAGQWAGRASPVKAYSPTIALDIEFEPGRSFSLRCEDLLGENSLGQESGSILNLELGLYVAKGEVELDASTTAKAGDLVILRASKKSPCSLADAAQSLADDHWLLMAQTDARVLVLGGEALDAPRYLWWNFVASSKDRIEQAKADWQQGRFPSLASDVEFIPLPQEQTSELGRKA
jgi:redox-sensitive bicupin YhaK (pirin superfamily)